MERNTYTIKSKGQKVSLQFMKNDGEETLPPSRFEAYGKGLNN